MKKNNYISLILLFVFSFVLVHNVIPHHHHHEVSEINNHEHNNHQDDNKEKDHHHENDELVGLFSHPTHILASTEFVFSTDNSIQKTQALSQFFLVSDLILTSTIIPVKRKPPNYISVVPLELFNFTYSLRGPPVFSA